MFTPFQDPTRSALDKRLGVQGFTLIELLVTVAIAGILAAVAYPSLSQYVQKSRRSDAIESLAAVVQAQERFRGNSSAYASELAALGIAETSKGGHYKIELTGIGAANSYATGYTASAAVIGTGRQADDSKCASMRIQLLSGSLIYSSLDSGGGDSTAGCWPK